MNILYSSDDGYAKYAGVSILSLLENNSKHDIVIFYIDNGVSDNNKQKLIKTVDYFGKTIKFIELKKLCPDLSNKDGFPVSSYARLFAERLDSAEKLIYIDCDTIITKDISDLYNTDISNYLAAGVQDCPAQFMIKSIGMKKCDRYINAGVLLMNVEKMRKIHFADKCLQMIEKYNGMVPHHDQGVINGLCRDDILILHPKYNAMSQFFLYTAKEIKKLFGVDKFYTQSELDEAVKSPVIIHYISKFYLRPWSKNCTHPLKNAYTDALDKSLWDNTLNDDTLPPKVKKRKNVYDNMPFFVFLMSEKILDIKRKKRFKKKYDFLDLDI